MELLGYSERGVVNALFHEIYHSQRSKALLQGLLSLVQFPFCADAMPQSVSDAQVLVEQSFSDFGDADVAVLLTAGKRRIAVFLEAKVQTAQGSPWTAEREFQKFQKAVSTDKVSCSNLFAQFYLKVQLVEGLRACPNGEVKYCKAELPPCFRKTKRKIGENTIVLEAASRVQDHLSEALFVALLPGEPGALEAFYVNTLKAAGDLGLPGWNVTNWGFLAWEDVKGFCVKNALHNTLAVFDYNAGAII